MSKVSYVNGNYLSNDKSLISINDRSFHFSDAVYEVIPVFNKNLVFWNEHLDRLEKSLKYLQIDFPLNKKILYFKCKEVIERNDMHEGILYLHISRGIETRNHNWSDKIIPSLIITVINKKIFNFSQRPISLITDDDIRWKKAYIKSTSLLPNVLLKKKATLMGAGECILKDRKGYITEATHSNIFIVKKGCLITPPLKKNILPGITRKKILDYANDLKINTAIKSFTEKDIYTSECAFISNSSSFIIEANRLNKKALKIVNKDIVKEIKKKFREVLNNVC